MGKYETIDFLNWVLFSSSVAEFWSKRYNLVISEFLRRNVYQPAVDRSMSRERALLLSFFVSGVLHSYVAHCAWGKGKLSALAFFMTHAAAILAERAIFPNNPSATLKGLRWLMLMAVLVGTFPLYPWLFVGSYPDFLRINLPSDPFGILPRLASSN